MTDDTLKPKKNYTSRQYSTNKYGHKIISHENIYKNIPNGSIWYSATYDRNTGNASHQRFHLTIGNDTYSTTREPMYSKINLMGIRVKAFGIEEHSNKNNTLHGVSKQYDSQTQIMSETIWINGKSYTPAELAFATYQNNGKSITDELTDPTPAVTAKIKYIDNAPEKTKKSKGKRNEDVPNV